MSRTALWKRFPVENAGHLLRFQLIFLQVKMEETKLFQFSILNKTTSLQTLGRR